MNIIQSIELFVAINLFAVGLSHFFQPKIWIDFFELLHDKKNAGNLFNAMIALGMGSFVLSFHFIWTWPKILITFYGLALVIKGTIYMVFPKVGINAIRKVKSNQIKWIGLVMFLLSLLIFYGL